jgi:hypothetical protein
MVFSFILEEKLDDATNISRYALVYAFQIISSRKTWVCLQGMHKRPYPRNNIGFSAFKGTSAPSIVVEDLGSRFD